MLDRVIATVYLVFAFLVVWIAVGALVDKPMSAQEYADGLCQQMYGPQTGALWDDGTMKCQTVRGEVLPLKRI